MSDHDIKVGDWVSATTPTGTKVEGRVERYTPFLFGPARVCIEESRSGELYWFDAAEVQACIYTPETKSPKYFCASRQPKEGHALMLVQREGEVVLTKDGKPLLKFVDGQEGFVVLGGAK